MGRKTPLVKKRKKRPAGVPWTDEHIAYMREHYATTENAELERILNHPAACIIVYAQKLGLKKDKSFISQLRSRPWQNENHLGRNSWFKTGNVPAHKGVRRPGYAPGRMKETLFKKGEGRGAENHKWVPVGTIKTDANGYQRIKVRESQPGEPSGFGNYEVWPVLHRYTWEQRNGPVPDGFVVTFKDGNKANAGDVENLVLISRGDLLKMHSINNLPEELQEVIRLTGRLTRKIRERIDNNAKRAA